MWLGCESLPDPQCKNSRWLTLSSVVRRPHGSQELLLLLVVGDPSRWPAEEAHYFSSWTRWLWCSTSSTTNLSASQHLHRQQLAYRTASAVGYAGPVAVLYQHLHLPHAATAASGMLQTSLSILEQHMQCCAVDKPSFCQRLTLQYSDPKMAMSAHDWPVQCLHTSPQMPAGMTS